MPKFSVVLVEPKYEGNIGFIARAMKNFGISSLYLVDPRVDLGDEAYSRAAHAGEVLDKARKVQFGDISKEFDFIVGTTGISKIDRSSKMKMLTPQQLSNSMGEVNGDVALLFGREDIGLKNEEQEICDLIVNIPASDDYPILNISHAACIVFYELFKDRDQENFITDEALGEEKEAMLANFSDLLDSIDYPNFKKKIIKRMFRRLVGRAGITGREAHRLAGVFRESVREIKR
ncbi:MAG: RNA methyltransferase [Candidatus Hydrothermarchaeales archaeon]